MIFHDIMNHGIRHLTTKAQESWNTEINDYPNSIFFQFGIPFIFP